MSSAATTSSGESEGTELISRPGPALLVPVGNAEHSGHSGMALGQADAALAAGADAIEFTEPDPGLITQFADRHPGVPFCAADGRAAFTRDLATARASGAWLLCDGPAPAAASGLPARRLVIATPLARLATVTGAGSLALVHADAEARAADQGWTDPDDWAGIVAAAGLAAWLGAAIVATRRPEAARLALDMAASISGTRPPARTVRGLA